MGWPCSGVRPSSLSSVRRPQFQRSSPLKLLDRSKPNIMWSILRRGGTKLYINGPGHMTKMAAMPIYV